MPLSLKNRIKNRLARYPLTESLRIKVHSFRKRPAILIYQMGKVGSATVYETLLRANLSHPIYHIHFLSNRGIRNAEEFFLNLTNPINPGHLRLSKILRQILDKNSGTGWKVITLVREPIARDISDFFQTLDRYHPELMENGEIKTNEIIELLVNAFSDYEPDADYANTWFDKELKNVFCVDVYAYGFDLEKGYSIIRDRGNAEVLILRVEDLNMNLENALVRFLDLNNPISIIKSNVGSEKKYAEAYGNVLKDIRIPKAVCRKIYSAKYAQHFYSKRMLDKFTQRWSQGKP
ncbi:MAG: putative capsular polysaccharide synthesis family protein [Candidatus Hermodarchaeia archaeon]|jgi:hypothetical protein